jgi:type II secretory pathway component GspD/PulD (secretin)
MIINVMLSQLTGENVNGQPVRTEMETTTNMIVQDGQTIMLGGILFQKDSVVERKIPLFGDVPVVGGLFRHNETMQGNNELIVFITPYVVDEPNNTLPETKEQIEKPREKLKEVQKQLDATMEALKED